MTTKQLRDNCERFAAVCLPCGVYAAALGEYQRLNKCDREKARAALGLATGGEAKTILGL